MKYIIKKLFNDQLSSGTTQINQDKEAFLL